MSTGQSPIIIGYDGTSHAAVALDWAAGQAQRQGIPLVVMTASDHGLTAGPGSWGPRLNEEAIIEIAAQGAARASRVAPLAEIAARTSRPASPSEASAAFALIDASRGAYLMVVGNRGRGELLGTATGSTGFEVISHAHSPVVVVRGDTAPSGPERPVVVGVDNSEHSDAAVGFAARAAAGTGAPLVIVGAFRSAADQAKTGAALLTLTGAPAHGSGLTFDDIVREPASQAVREAKLIATLAQPGLTIIERVLEGTPVDVLRGAAAGAGLLVVGSRGRGAFASLTLGSVSRGVIHAAGCPVAVVR